MKKTIFRMMLVGALLFANCMSLAAEGSAASKMLKGKKRDAAKPTVITSDKLEFDYHDFVALFEGNVKVNDQDFKLTADKMLVFFDSKSKTNEITRLDAVGNVNVEHEGNTATCSKAVYTRENGLIELTGSPVLTKAPGNQSIAGDPIRIWLAAERIEVLNGVQLSGTADPQ